MNLDTFQTVLQIAGTWGLDAKDARTAVYEELGKIYQEMGKIKGPAAHTAPIRQARVGLDREAQFEKANTMREAFYAAIKRLKVAAKPPARKPVTAAEFEEDPGRRGRNRGFMDLFESSEKRYGASEIGTRYWATIHYLDPDAS